MNNFFSLLYLALGGLHEFRLVKRHEQGLYVMVQKAYICTHGIVISRACK
jgi:hypothetical protein